MPNAPGSTVCKSNRIGLPLTSFTLERRFWVVKATMSPVVRPWIWPVVSVLICVAIVWSTWSLLRDSLFMSLDAVPASVDPEAVRAFLLKQPGVDGLHDLHIWPMSTTEIALTAHLVMTGGHPGDVFLHELCEELEHRFSICHATVQIEVDRKIACELAPDEVV